MHGLTCRLLLAGALLWLLPSGSRGAPREPVETARARLEALLKPDLEAPTVEEPPLIRKDPAREIRAHRAIRILETAGRGSEAREAARWFLERYTAPLHTRDFYAAANTALLTLAEAVSESRLSPEERRALAKFAAPISVFTGLAQLLLLDDDFRGRPERERLAAYEQALQHNPAGLMHAFLLVCRMQVPAALRHHWEWGPRFEKTRRPSYEGWAEDHYYRFRSMRFRSTGEEIQFLWGRIMAHYERLVREPRLPEGLEEQRREEPRAAAARLIEIGEPVASFLLARRSFILQAGDPNGIRAQDGDIYELWVMLGLSRREFVPILRQLSRSTSPTVQSSARRVLEAILDEDPYPYKALLVHEFRPSPHF